ncbi:HAMP domain-containing histidine kinase [bacterium]|nr:HAMP domain-containing histidine kinase [bacterium]
MKKQKEVNSQTELAFLVHDLEPALASFQTIVGLLKRGRYDGANKLHQNLVSSCDQALDFSRTMLQDILDLGKMQSQDIILDSGEIDWFESLPAMLAIPMLLSQEKDVELVLENSNCQLVSRTDAKLVQRVLNNLAINSIKYSSPGDRVWISARSETGDGIIVEIEDEGPGVTPEQLPYIFNDYYQSGGSTLDSYRGVGLGLPFCRQAVALLKGQIEVENRSPTGLRFTITLPNL